MTLKLIAMGGLGTMLGPSAHHLQNTNAAKYLRIFDRGNPGEQRDKRRQAWKGHGAALVPSYEALIADGDFDGVVICAGKNGDDYLIFKALVPLLKAAQARVGKTYFILHMSTVSCDFVEATHAYCVNHQIQYVNYPLTGGAKGAETAQMLVLASGDRQLYERVKPMLDCIGVPEYFGEDLTRATAVKLIGHVMVFHGLLGITLATVLHKNVCGFPQLNEAQVPFFDFLNKGAGGTRQWDLVLRLALADQHWDRGFLIEYGVIDALYTAQLLMEQNLPRMLVLPLLEVVLLFTYVLHREKDKRLATQTIAHILDEVPKADIDHYLKKHLSMDVNESFEKCVETLPSGLKQVLMLDVAY